MSEPRHSAQLIPFGEVHRLVQERRRRPRPAGPSAHAGSFSAPRSTSQVRRLLVEHRAEPPSGPEAA
jgi:hypothetical protein